MDLEHAFYEYYYVLRFYLFVCVCETEIVCSYRKTNSDLSGKLIKYKCI